jgi:hypothetical protein
MDTCKDGLELDLWNRVFKPRATHTQKDTCGNSLYFQNQIQHSHKQIETYIYICTRAVDMRLKPHVLAFA